jgi:hypothetical protein
MPAQTALRMPFGYPGSIKMKIQTEEETRSAHNT